MALGTVCNCAQLGQIAGFSLKQACRELRPFALHNKLCAHWKQKKKKERLRALDNLSMAEISHLP
jgi:hypothetical protein